MTHNARRARVRREGWYGLDGVDVDPDDPRTLVVTFLGKAPDGLNEANFRIEGGRRVTGLRVMHLGLPAEQAPETQDRVLVTTDRIGDLSTYTLHLQDVPGTDSRLGSAPFTYAALCPAGTDCVREGAEAAPPTQPDIDYLAKDYASFRRLLFDRLSLLMPEWTERHAPDLGVTLVELLAYAGDQLSYRQDAVATEAYLGTARRRVSIRRHVRLVDYRMHEGCNARAWVCVAVDRALTLAPGDVHFSTADGAVVFEPVSRRPVRLLPAHNTLRFWTWGGDTCCLPTGATSATLTDDHLGLRPGDVLILEETRDPATGVSEDADPAHRQAVRLTTVHRAQDELYGQAVVEVTWEPEDALARPLVIAVPDKHGGTLTCAAARGNAVLVDHGVTGTAGPPPWDGPLTRSVAFPRPATVSRSQARLLRAIPERARHRVRDLHTRTDDGRPLSQGELAELRALFGASTLQRRHFPQARPGSHRQPTAAEQERALKGLLDAWPRLLSTKIRWLRGLARRARAGLVLGDRELTEIREAWGEDYTDGLAAEDPMHAGPACEALLQDPREALPALRIDSAEGAWTAQHDLLDSGPEDRHFVAETDDDGVVHPRFGDGRLGRALPPGTALDGLRRTGNGTAGNLGAGTITRLTSRTSDLPEVRSVGNPLPAAGGTDPETSARVRQFAPGSYRHELKRAVTAADYATLAADMPGVQRADARLRWNGSWYEVQVAVDPLGTEEAVPELQEQVRELLFRYRRAGHELHVQQALYVPLSVALQVCVLPHYVRDDVAGAVRSAFARHFHPDNLTFGTRIEASPLVALAQSVPGVESVELLWLKRLGESDTASAPQKHVMLRGLEIPRLDDDPAAPENGVLELRTGGGR
ncbi:putative baseplate assembly protein [Streptomyces sp. ODS28]|uniref:putative baseplate assembly protein n=1 Tax=Streptomyces sp. ODS28 TaxID=3136688 RepID=UPI0031EDA60F